MAENGIVVAMVVRDAEAILDFYQNTLGLKFGWSSPISEHRKRIVLYGYS